MNEQPSKRVSELIEYMKTHLSDSIWVRRGLFDKTVWYIAERVSTHNDPIWNSFGTITLEEAQYLHNNKIICVYHNFVGKDGKVEW